MNQNNSSRKPWLFRLFSGLWRFITWLRVAVFNLLFLLVLAIIVAAVFAPKDAPMPAKGPLFISVNGVFVDQKTYISPASRLMNQGNGQPQETDIRELISVVNKAATDPKITGLVLQLDYFEGGGMSKIEEVGQALLAFKATGKPVIAYSDSYTQHAYLLASFADEIYMHTMGNVLLTGLGLYRNYYKEAIDKLDVNFHVFKVGEFKDFVEPYTRTSMSDASRAHNRQWLTQLWQAYTAQVESRRELAPGTLDHMIANINEIMAAHGGNGAALALAADLIDFAGTRLEQEARLAERFGEGEDTAFVHIPYAAYRADRFRPEVSPSGNIGLIVASGNILDGYQPPGTIGGDSLSELIRMAREDDNLKALVLRVDSGGGSAFASELIRNELDAVRAKGVPVVVSMGSVAASGGYWVAMGADEVWATPNTITGSIGVFGLMPTLEKTLAKIGVHTDGIGTTDLAGALRVDRPLDPKAAAAYQQGVEAIYDTFLGIVASSRDSSVEAVHEVAQGRVWTGSTAKQLDLIDQLGYLQDAIAAAAARAEITDYKVKLIDFPRSPQEVLLEQLLEQAYASGATGLLQNHWQTTPPALLQLLQKLVQEATVFNPVAPLRGAYAACMECIAP